MFDSTKLVRFGNSFPDSQIDIFGSSFLEYFQPRTFQVRLGTTVNADCYNYFYDPSTRAYQEVRPHRCG
jgi:hypothetical protein